MNAWQSLSDKEIVRLLFDVCRKQGYCFKSNDYKVKRDLRKEIYRNALTAHHAMLSLQELMLKLTLSKGY